MPRWANEKSPEFTRFRKSDDNRKPRRQDLVKKKPRSGHTGRAPNRWCNQQPKRQHTMGTEINVQLLLPGDPDQVVTWTETFWWIFSTISTTKICAVSQNCVRCKGETQALWHHSWLLPMATFSQVGIFWPQLIWRILKLGFIFIEFNYLSVLWFAFIYKHIFKCLFAYLCVCTLFIHGRTVAPHGPKFWVYVLKNPTSLPQAVLARLCL